MSHHRGPKPGSSRPDLLNDSYEETPDVKIGRLRRRERRLHRFWFGIALLVFCVGLSLGIFSETMAGQLTRLDETILVSLGTFALGFAIGYLLTGRSS